MLAAAVVAVALTSPAVSRAQAPLPPPTAQLVADLTAPSPLVLPNRNVSFTASFTGGSGTIVNWSWNFNTGVSQQQASGPTATVSFPSAGTYDVSVTITDSAGATATAAKKVTVDQPPTASFNILPRAQIVAGDSATFVSTSTDADGTVAGFSWDLNGDGRFGDAVGPNPRLRYTRPGVYVIGLQVADNLGATATTTAPLTVVADIPPVAAFGFSPSAPTAGEPVTFTSRSTDADGTIVGYSWDFNGDNRFGDASGPTVTHTFPTGGSFSVQLRVTDDRGVSSVAFQSVAIRGTVSPQDAQAVPQPGTSATGAHPLGSSPSPGAPGATRASLMSPFPIVHIRGRIFGARVKIDLLSVRAPKGAVVRVRCRGRTLGCPKPGTTTARARSGRLPVRVRALERPYQPGAVIEVYVTLRGRIGKYVRFTMRRGKAPLRRDLCVASPTGRPGACPTG